MNLKGINETESEYMSTSPSIADFPRSSTAGEQIRRNGPAPSPAL